MHTNKKFYTSTFLTMHDKHGKPLQVLFEDEQVTIYKLEDHIWLIQTKQGVTSSIYVIEGSEKSMVIDAGFCVKNLPSYVSKLTSKPQLMVLTHGHLDHIGSINEYDEVYVHEAEVPMIKDYKGKLTTFKFGHVFDIGNIHIAAYDLSAHTPGSTGLLDIEDRCIFTGDAIGSTSCWIWLSKLPLEKLTDVLNCLEDISDKFDIIYLGHYNQMGSPADIHYVKKLKVLLDKILRSEDVKTTPFELDDHLRKEFPGISPLVAELDGVQIVYNPKNIHFI